VSNTSGAAGDITISSNTTGLNFNLGSNGADANLTVDGIPIDSSSNTVTGAIPGVTLSLLAVTSSPVTLQVSHDTSQAATAINNFVTDYNTVISSINSQFSYDTTTGTAGALLGDPSVELVQSTLLSDVAANVTENGAISSLATLGITMNNDGTLTLDSATLDSAVQNNFAAVQAFMQGTSSNGFVSFLNNLMTSLTDPTSGAFTVDLQSISSENTDLQNQINNFQPYLQNEQTILTNEFNQADIALQELPTEEAQINAELGYPPSGSSTTIL